MHTPIAACVYEKSPQTIADAITKVERLQAVQQLTASLLPPSMVNTISTEDERCYQCKRWETWYNTAQGYDVLIVTNMGM